MASPLKFNVFVVCILVLVAVVAAQYGNETSASPPNLSYPTAIIVLLPFMLTFLAAKQRILV